MKAHTVKLVQNVEGQLVVSTTKIENIEAFMSVRGFEQNGTQPARSGSIALREEIAGQPKFAGLMGPMYDGEGIVRYECAEAYRQLSA